MEKKRYFEAPFKDPINLTVYEEEAEPWTTIKQQLVKENDQDKEEKIRQFLELYKSDPVVAKWRVPEDGDKWEKRERLIKFLRAGSWDVQASLDILKNYLDSGRLYTSVVRESLPSRLDKVWNLQLNAITEYRDADGRRIYVYRPGKWNPDEVTVDQFFASQYCMFELLADEIRNQIAGVTCVADISGFGLKHIRNFGIEQVKCMTSFMSGSFPLWIRKIHVVNNPSLFSVLYNMMRPLLDERVKNNMVFHGSNYTELHKEIPPSILPKSMGGTGEMNNSESVRLMKERTSLYQDIVDKALKHST